MKKNLIAILTLIPFISFGQGFDENKNPFVSEKKILNLSSFQNARSLDFNDRWKIINSNLNVSVLNDAGSSLVFSSNYLNYDNISEGAFLKDSNNHYEIAYHYWGKKYYNSASYSWRYSNYSKPQYYFINFEFQF